MDSLSDLVIMGHIEHDDEERLSRKLRRLLENNKGQSLFSILFSKSNIRDEYTPIEKIDNKKLEEHVDKALSE